MGTGKNVLPPDFAYDVFRFYPFYTCIELEIVVVVVIPFCKEELSRIPTLSALHMESEDKGLD